MKQHERESAAQNYNFSLALNKIDGDNLSQAGEPP